MRPLFTGIIFILLHHHDVTIYSISPFTELLDDFVSCGEDGTMRVWRGIFHSINYCNTDKEVLNRYKLL